MLDEIRGAVARGWCSKENEHKVIDPTLAEAIAQEVNKLVHSKFTLPSKQSTPCQDHEYSTYEVSECVHCGHKLASY